MTARILCILMLVAYNQLYAQSYEKEYDFGMQEQIYHSVELQGGGSIHAVKVGTLFDDYFYYTDSCKFIKTDASGKLLSSNTFYDFFATGMRINNDTITVLGYANRFVKGYSVILTLDTNLNVLDTIANRGNYVYAYVSNEFVRKVNGDVIYSISEADSSNGGISKILTYNNTGSLINETIYDTTVSLSNLGGGIFYHSVLKDYFLMQAGSLDSNVNNGFSLHRLNDSLQIIQSVNLNTGITNPSFGTDSLKFENTFFALALANGNIACGGGVHNPMNLNSTSKQSLDNGFILYDSSLNRIQSYVFGPTDTADSPCYHTLIADSMYLYYLSNKGSASNYDFYESKITYGHLIKMDLDGNVLTDRYYNNGKFTVFYDFIRTHDGGFMLSGSTYDSINNLSEGINAYILRLDSAGNLLTGINEYSGFSERDVLVYPNPSSEIVNFQKVNYFKPYELRIYDESGNLIQSKEWSNDRLEISLSNFSTGVYLYQIENKQGELVSGKFIKVD